LWRSHCVLPCPRRRPWWRGPRRRRGLLPHAPRVRRLWCRWRMRPLRLARRPGGRRRPALALPPRQHPPRQHPRHQAHLHGVAERESAELRRHTWPGRVPGGPAHAILDEVQRRRFQAPRRAVPQLRLSGDRDILGTLRCRNAGEACLKLPRDIEAGPVWVSDVLVRIRRHTRHPRRVCQYL